MCLDTIYEKKSRQKFAYKVFMKRKKNNYFRCSFESDTIMKLGKTYADKNTFRLDCHSENKNYLTGYHCFKKKADAIRLARSYEEIVVKVAIENIIACGHQRFEFLGLPADIIVARKITLLEIVKDFYNG